MTLKQNGPDKKISPEEYKKRLISDIRPISRIEEDKKAEETPTDLESDDQTDVNFDEQDNQQEELINQLDLANRSFKQEPTSEPTTPEQQILQSQKEVPKYSAQPEQPEKNLPGGPAVKPKNQLTPEAEKILPKKGVAKTATNAVADLAKKAAQAAVKMAVQIGAKIATATSGYWLPILLGAIGIVIIVMGLIFLIRALQTPNVNGSSPLQAADVVVDRPWISKVLALSGKNNISASLTSEMLSGLESDLATMKSDLSKPPLSNYDDPTKQKISAKIEEISKLISVFKTMSSSNEKYAESGKKIFTALGELLDYFSTVSFRYSGETAYPIKASEVRGFNSSLHGGTPMRCEPKEGHGTFSNNNKCTSDATDLMAPGGTSVYAAFSGTIVRKGYHMGYYIYVEGKDNEGKTFKAVYAHLQNVTSSKEITVGEKIAELSTKLNHPHLHFELLCNNQAVTTTADDMANFRASGRKYSVVGEYLYVRILNVLNKTP